MITNFEGITSELTDEEKKLIPILIDGFRKRNKDNSIKAPEIIERINGSKERLGLKKKLTEPRLRKLCNHIRSNSLFPLIATSNGYYCSYDREEIEAQIISLKSSLVLKKNTQNMLIHDCNAW